ncbi:hypothetical protein GCM10009551_088030 [Nocardiopsis tropica]
MRAVHHRNPAERESVDGRRGRVTVDGLAVRARRPVGVSRPVHAVDDPGAVHPVHTIGRRRSAECEAVETGRLGVVHRIRESVLCRCSATRGRLDVAAGLHGGLERGAGSGHAPEGHEALVEVVGLRQLHFTDGHPRRGFGGLRPPVRDQRLDLRRGILALEFEGTLQRFDLRLDLLHDLRLLEIDLLQVPRHLTERAGDVHQGLADPDDADEALRPGPGLGFEELVHLALELGRGGSALTGHTEGVRRCLGRRERPRGQIVGSDLLFPDAVQQDIGVGSVGTVDHRATSRSG